MRRRLHCWMFGALAMVFVVAAVIALSQLSFAQAPPPAGGSTSYEVVLMRCKSSAAFGVKEYQGSPGTPVKKSDNCAENLSLLMREGFEIRDVGHYYFTDDGFVVYTLIR